MLIHFGQSSYFKANKGVDRYFLENYLLPGLEKQAVIAGGSKGIELPVGENQEPEYLSLEEAKALVLDWLEQSHNLLESDKKKLERLKNYEQFANLANNIYESKVKDPNKLVTAARLQNVADLRADKKRSESSTATPRFDPGKVIDDYNKMYLKLLSSSRVGIPHSLLQQIVSSGIPSGAGNMREEALAAVISANLTRLHAAGSVGTSKEAQQFAVARELGNIISTSYPEMTGILNILGDSQTAASLHEVTNRLTKELEATTTLDSYEKSQVEAIAATDNYLLNQSELRNHIYNSFPSMGAKDRQVLTNAILTEMVSSAGRPLTSTEIIDRVSQKMNIAPSELATIQAAIMSSGVDVSLEYRQNELSLMLGSRYLTRGERNLLNKGINPFTTHTPQEKLVGIESKLLAEYNAIPGHTKKFSSIQEAYLNEQESDRPNLVWMESSRSHLNQRDSFDNLSLSDKALVRRTRFGRWVTDTRSRFYETQSKFLDKWVDIEDTITGKKLFNKIYDNWDKFAEGFTIPGTKIPLFRIVPWITDRIDEWKKVTTLNTITRTSKSTGWVGKTIHWAAKQYELGGFTTSGATAHFAHAQWGKVVKWGLAKTGMTGVVKYAGVSAARTATRLLIKIGGKALAKLGAKAIGALVTAATTIGTVIFAIGMIFDLVSMAFEFLKEFIRNSEFHKTVIKWGTAISVFVASINLGGFFIAMGAILGSSFAILMTALIIVGGILFITPQIQNNIKNTYNLDSGISNLIANIICDESGNTTIPGTTSQNTTPSTSPSGGVATRAACLAKYLNQCYGPSVNASNISTGLSCLATYAIAPAAIEEIKRSASGYVNLQCVGFVKAAVAWAGQSISSHNACGYIDDPKFVSGLSGVKPGDAIVFKSSGTCSDEAPGHIGILKEDAGATICLIDANQKCPGCVVDGNCLPKTNVAGYLRL